MDSDQPALKKTLSRWDSVAINIAIVIAAGLAITGIPVFLISCKTGG